VITSYDIGVLSYNPSCYWKLEDAAGVSFVDEIAANNAATGWGTKTSAIPQIVSNKFSVVGWWKIVDLSTSNTPLVCASYSGGHVDPFYTFYLGTNGIATQWRVAIATSGTFLPVTIGGAMPVGSGWTHIALTWDGTTATVYENAVVEGSPGAIAGASVLGMGSFAINNIPALDAFNYASGSSASRVAYWNDRCLTQADIAALYSLRNTPLGDAPTPVPPIFHGRGAA